MHARLRQACLTTAAVVLAATVTTGCGAEDWSRPHAAPTAIGSLKPEFTPSGPPAPEGTITPEPGSWDDVRPSKDFRVVLLRSGKDKQTSTMARAVVNWAEDENVSLRTVTADDARKLLDDIDRARTLEPDLIISVGNNLIDPLATVTPHFLDQKFLVIGAELAEPTHNVTAADWAGASFRGEGLGASSSYDPTSFTPERSARAVRAGVAAVLSGLTGIVIWLG